MKLDNILVKKVAGAKNSSIGRFLSSIILKGWGVTILACLNVLCTFTLGFMMTYPLYIMGGFWMALPTGLLTFALIIILSANILNNKLGWTQGSTLRKLLILAILLSLPFGLLSLPLLKNSSPSKYPDKNEQL
ncbi:hypothetical protein K8R43_05685 [archaeon]|nr:hypothetical protein [archaeon]